PPPRADHLRASRDWVRLRFGFEGRADTALRQVNRSLAEIESYQFYFLISKASLLSYLERWEELASHLRSLANHFPREGEVWNKVAEFFAAHGDWRSCLTVLNRAAPLIRSSADRHLLDDYYYTKLTCLYALGLKTRAVREGRSILRKLPRKANTGFILKHIEADQLKVDAWAPHAATYLREMRRLAT